MHQGMDKSALSYICDITSAVSSLLGWHVTPSQASQLVGAQGSPFHPILSGTLNDSFNALMATTTETKTHSQLLISNSKKPITPKSHTYLAPARWRDH